MSEGDCEPRAWQRGTCWPWRGLWLQVQVPPGHWRAWAGQDSRLNRSSLAAVWRMYWGYQKHKPGDLLGWGLCSNQVTDASGSGHGVAVDGVWTCSKGSAQFSCSVMSDSLQPHGLQHARPPCPSLPPRVCPRSCLLNQ